MKSNKSIQNNIAFTIVELLVVIVIIGILAAITIISYSGVSKKAIVTSLQSDLDGDAKLLKLYNVDYGYYPNTLDASNCPATPTVDARYCLEASTGTALTYNGGGQTFRLRATKDGISYEITENSAPYDVTVTPITKIGTIDIPVRIGQTLTAGAVTPAEATVSYQWQSAATSGGTYTNIPGAISSTYLVSPSQMTRYIRVVATASGQFGGSVSSTGTASAVVTDPNWLIIGSQAWAKANMNVGTLITKSNAQTNNSIIEKYCVSDAEGNCTVYGGLYRWNEAMQYVTTEGAQGICPAGSHIPSDNDWKVLEMQLGMTQAQADALNARGTTQGTQLKAGGSSGLNMPLGGFLSDPYYTFVAYYAYLWSSSESSTSAWDRTIYVSSANISRETSAKNLALSVRCVGN